MKTFNESDLITWSNRENAILGNEYYFANNIADMWRHVENAIFRDKLVSINEDDFRGTFKSREEDDYAFDYACILPVDKVIEVEPEKTYRALKSILNKLKKDWIYFPNTVWICGIKC